MLHSPAALDNVSILTLSHAPCQLEEMVKYLPLAVSSVEEEEEFYLASLLRTPHSVMPEVIFMRGAVATGEHIRQDAHIVFTHTNPVCFAFEPIR